MATDRKKLYEGMFLVGAGEAASNWDETEGTIRNILQRADAEIVSVRKWDERRLAYEVDGVDRGTYVLSYFKTEGPRVADIERDVRLTEQILRALILATEPMPEDMPERETPVMKEQRLREEAAARRAEEQAAAEAEEQAKEDEKAAVAAESEEPDISEESDESGDEEWSGEDFGEEKEGGSGEEE